jgi:RimJ/RimL family protein N-acetyltransferase
LNFFRQPKLKANTPRHLFEVYSAVHKVAQNIIHTLDWSKFDDYFLPTSDDWYKLGKYSELARKFVKFLDACQGTKIYVKGQPPRDLDMKPIKKMVDEANEELPISIEKLDKNNSLIVKEAARITHDLSLYWIGDAFGPYFLKKVMESEDSLCLLARNEEEDKIVGTCLAVLTPIDDETKTKILHIWVAVREANYPIHFLDKIHANLDHYLQDRDVDFLTLCVYIDNVKARELYEKYGFKEVERNKSKIFMVKQLKEEAIAPSFKTASKAIERHALKIGGWLGVADYLTSMCVQLFNNLRFR